MAPIYVHKFSVYMLQHNTHLCKIRALIPFKQAHPFTSDFAATPQKRSLLTATNCKKKTSDF